jgi:hypothetical protein
VPFRRCGRNIQFVSGPSNCADGLLHESAEKSRRVEDLAANKPADIAIEGRMCAVTSGTRKMLHGAVRLHPTQALAAKSNEIEKKGRTFGCTPLAGLSTVVRPDVFDSVYCGSLERR